MAKQQSPCCVWFTGLSAAGLVSDVACVECRPGTLESWLIDRFVVYLPRAAVRIRHAPWQLRPVALSEATPPFAGAKLVGAFAADPLDVEVTKLLVGEQTVRGSAGASR